MDFFVKVCNAWWIQGEARRRTGYESDDAHCCFGGGVACVFKREQRGSFERGDAEIFRGSYSTGHGC
jgi:hypothetical protein